MQQDITKICADSLRSYFSYKYSVKLKLGHAHQMVAAFFGFKSRIAMLADKNQIVNNWVAEFILLDPPIYFILNPTIPLLNQRLQNLHDLPLDLPPSYVMAEVIYSILVAQLRLQRRLRTFFKSGFPSIKWEMDVNTAHNNDGAVLTVDVGYRSSAGERLKDSTYTIRLPRVAANSGYSTPSIDETIFTGGARKYGDS